MSPERTDGKESQDEVRPSRVLKIARKGSTVLKWLKVSAAIILFLSFFLPWASQVKGCSDDNVVRERISGLSLAVDDGETEAVVAPVVGIAVFVLALMVSGIRNPLARSLISIFEAPAVYSSAVFISMGIFFLSPYRERYGFYIAMFSLFALSAFSFLEVFSHFPMLKRRGKAIVVAVVLSLLLFLIVSSIIGKG